MSGEQKQPEVIEIQQGFSFKQIGGFLAAACSLVLLVGWINSKEARTTQIEAKTGSLERRVDNIEESLEKIADKVEQSNKEAVAAINEQGKHIAVIMDRLNFLGDIKEELKQWGVDYEAAQKGSK